LSLANAEKHLLSFFPKLTRDVLFLPEQKGNKKDFVMHLKMGKKIHLKEYEADSLAEDLNAFFDRMIGIERIKVGNRQTIDTLINEEALLLANYLRNERKDWIPRLTNPKSD
jgi:hypothetical protein